MPRAVTEWRSDNPDAKVPARVRLRIWRRQCGGGNFAICELSGAILRSTSECQLDHIIPLIENGAHAESNLRYVLTEAHREKSAGEVKLKAHVDATAKRHAGIKAAPSSLSVPAAVTKARKEARSKDRANGKLPVPDFYLPPGFEAATSKG